MSLNVSETMKRMLGIAILSLLAFCQMSCPPGGQVAQRQGRIADPYADVLAVRSMSDGGSLERFRLDVNGDNIEELFIANSSDSGTGGNTFHAYRKAGDGYEYIGLFFLKTLKCLDARREGYHDLLGWNRTGGTEGEEYGPTTRYTWNGRQYAAGAVQLNVKLRDLRPFNPRTHEYGPAPAWHPRWHPPELERCRYYRTGNRNWTTRR